MRASVGDVLCIFFLYKRAGAERDNTQEMPLLFPSSRETVCFIGRHLTRHGWFFKIGVLVVLVDLFYHVLCALKCMSFSVFSLQTEHLPLQTQFKERETGNVQHPVSNMIL